MIDRRWIGHEYPPSVLAVERTRLRFFAKAIGETAPVYTDVAAARAAGFADLPAPPTFLFAAELDAGLVDRLLDELGIPLARLLHGEQGFTYHRAVCAGDTITVRSRLTDVYEKKGGALELVEKTSRAVNQRDEPVAELRTVLVCRNPPAGGEAAAAARPVAAPPARERAPAQVGEPLPELQVPPVRRATLALFAGASGDHNPIHIDLDFARSAGQPDVFAQGMLGMAWLGRLLTSWAPQARLRRLDARFQGITHLGDAITCRGAVVETLERDGERCARVEVRSTNQDGETKISGEALVALRPEEDTK